MKNLGRSLSLLGVLVVLIKLISVTWGASYIANGLDPARLLAQVQYTVGTGVLQTYISPRILLHYFSLFEQLVLWISPWNLFIVPLVFIFGASLVIIYSLAKDYCSDSFKAGFAVFVYALSLTMIRVTYSTIFTMWLGPATIFLYIRFLQNRASIWLLAILYLGGLLTYSPLLLIINVILFFVTLVYIFGQYASNHKEEIKRVSRFFLLMPIIFGLIYPFDSRVVLDSYSSALVYVSRSFGLWVSSDIIPINAVIIYIFFAVSFIAGVLFGWTPIKSITLPKLMVSTKLFKRLTLILVGICILVFSYDSIQVIGSVRSIESKEFISYLLFNSIFGWELWRNIFWPFIIIYLMAAVSLIVTRRPKDYIVFILYVFILLVPIIGSVLRSISIFDLLSNERGFRLVTPFVCVLAAGVAPLLLKNKAFLLSIVTLLFILGFQAVLQTRTFADTRFLVLTDWYRNNVGSSDVFVASLDIFPLGEPTETYYSLSLVPWKYPFWHQNLLNNTLQKSCVNQTGFITDLKKAGYRYIIAEPYYSNPVITTIPDGKYGKVLWGKLDNGIFKSGAVIELNN